MILVHSSSQTSNKQSNKQSNNTITTFQSPKRKVTPKRRRGEEQQTLGGTQKSLSLAKNKQTVSALAKIKSIKSEPNRNEQMYVSEVRCGANKPTKPNEATAPG